MSFSREESVGVPESGTRSRRTGKSAGRSVNRAQVQAMEARTQRILSGPSQGTRNAAAVQETPMAATSRTTGVRSTARARNRAVARPMPLTRTEEYSYIRADLRRLLVTAGALLVVMIVLLFIFER